MREIYSKYFIRENLRLDWRVPKCRVVPPVFLHKKKKLFLVFYQIKRHQVRLATILSFLIDFMLLY